MAATPPLGVERLTTRPAFDDVLSEAPAYISRGFSVDDDAPHNSLPASAHASWAREDGGEDGDGKVTRLGRRRDSKASRMGRRRSVMRSLGQGLGNLVKTLSRAISGIGSTFSRSISRISQDELDEALGDTAPRNSDAAAVARAAPPPDPRASESFTSRPAPALPKPKPGPLPHPPARPAAQARADTDDRTRALQEMPPELHRDLMGVMRLPTPVGGIEPPPLDAWDPSRFEDARDSSSDVPESAERSPRAHTSARWNPVGAVHQARGEAPRARPQPAKLSDQLWDFKAPHRNDSGGLMSLGDVLSPKADVGSGRGDQMSDHSSVIEDMQAVSLTNGWAGALAESERIARYEHAQDREREHYLSSRSMRMRGANGRGGEHEPTLKDLQAAGLQHTYDAMMDLGRNMRREFRSSRASQSGMGSIAPASEPPPGPTRAQSNWSKARTVTKATTFLSIASTRFRALQQLATKSLEDIYEDEPGETKESKYGGRAYQMALEASVNEEAHQALMHLEMEGRKQAKQDRVAKYQARKAEEDKQRADHFRELLLQQQAETVAAAVIQTYARRWLAARMVARLRMRRRLEREREEEHRRAMAEAAERERAAEEERRAREAEERARVAGVLEERMKAAKVKHVSRVRRHGQGQAPSGLASVREGLSPTPPGWASPAPPRGNALFSAVRGPTATADTEPILRDPEGPRPVIGRQKSLSLMDDRDMSSLEPDRADIPLVYTSPYQVPFPARNKHQTETHPALPPLLHDHRSSRALHPGNFAGGPSARFDLAASQLRQSADESPLPFIRGATSSTLAPSSGAKAASPAASHTLPAAPSPRVMKSHAGTPGTPTSPAPNGASPGMAWSGGPHSPSPVLGQDLSFAPLFARRPNGPASHDSPARLGQLSPGGLLMMGAGGGGANASALGLQGIRGDAVSAHDGSPLPQFPSIPDRDARPVRAAASQSTIRLAPRALPAKAASAVGPRGSAALGPGRALHASSDAPRGAWGTVAGRGVHGGPGEARGVPVKAATAALGSRVLAMEPSDAGRAPWGARSEAALGRSSAGIGDGDVARAEGGAGEGGLHDAIAEGAAEAGRLARQRSLSESGGATASDMATLAEVVAEQAKIASPESLTGAEAPQGDGEGADSRRDVLARMAAQLEVGTLASVQGNASYRNLGAGQSWKSNSSGHSFRSRESSSRSLALHQSSRRMQLENLERRLGLGPVPSSAGLGRSVGEGSSQDALPAMIPE